MTRSESQVAADRREAGALALLFVVVLWATVGGVVPRAMPSERSTRSSMTHAWPSIEAGTAIVCAQDARRHPADRAAARSAAEPAGLGARSHGLPPIRGPTGPA